MAFNIISPVLDSTYNTGQTCHVQCNITSSYDSIELRTYEGDSENMIEVIGTTESFDWVIPASYSAYSSVRIDLYAARGSPDPMPVAYTSIKIGNSSAYVWKSNRTGNNTALHAWNIGTDGMYHGVAVLRQGINGFSSDTKAITSTANLDNMGEFLQEYSWSRRDGFGFRIAILGNGRTEIDTKRRQLLLEMSDGGELKIIFADGTKVHVYIDKVTMTVSDGLEANPRVQYADLSFTALNPYFYGDTVTASGLSGNVTITNAGNVPAEATFTLSANTVTRTVGTEVKTIAAVTGESLSGVVLTVKDNSIAAVSGTTNAMHKFTLNSEFFLLESGGNVVNGISAYSYVPRWSAI